MLPFKIRVSHRILLYFHLEGRMWCSYSVSMRQYKPAVWQPRSCVYDDTAPQSFRQLVSSDPNPYPWLTCDNLWTALESFHTPSIPRTLQSLRDGGMGLRLEDQYAASERQMLSRVAVHAVVQGRW